MNKHRNFIDVMLECDNCYDEEIVVFILFCMVL